MVLGRIILEENLSSITLSTFCYEIRVPNVSSGWLGHQGTLGPRLLLPAPPW